MKKYTILLSIILLGGCSSLPETKLVGSIELNHTIPAISDYWVNPARPWGCNPPQFRGEIGFQTKNKWEAGFYHESFVVCGSVNKQPEIYENGFYVKKIWGGY